MKKFVVTAVEYGETYDGKARVLGLFGTEDAAKDYVYEDIELWCFLNRGKDMIVNHEEMSVRYKYEYDDGCEWNVEEIEI